MDSPEHVLHFATRPRLEPSVLLATAYSRSQSVWNSRIPAEHARIDTTNAQARKRANRMTTITFADQGGVPDFMESLDSPSDLHIPPSSAFSKTRSSSSSRRNSSIYYKPPRENEDDVKSPSKRVSIVGHEPSRRFSLPISPSHSRHASIASPSPTERLRSGTIKPLRLSKQFKLAPSRLTVETQPSFFRRVKFWLKRLFLLPALFFLFLNAALRIQRKDLERDKALKKLTLSPSLQAGEEMQPRSSFIQSPGPLQHSPFDAHNHDDDFPDDPDNPTSPVALLHGLDYGQPLWF